MPKKLDVHVLVEQGWRWKHSVRISPGPRDSWLGTILEKIPIAQGQDRNKTIQRAISRLEHCIQQLHKELNR